MLTNLHIRMFPLLKQKLPIFSSVSGINNFLVSLTNVHQKARSAGVKYNICTLLLFSIIIQVPLIISHYVTVKKVCYITFQLSLEITL